MSNTLKPFAFALPLIGLLSACQNTTTTPALPLERHTITTVSNTSSYFRPRSSDVFSWQGDIQVINAGSDSPAHQPIKLIRQELEQQLLHKGYQVVSNQQASNYYLQGVVTYKLPNQDVKLQQNYGIDAGLGSDNNSQQRGSLLLIIASPSGRTAWRGEVQIYNDPSLTAELRKQRLTAAIQSMLATLPAAQ